MLEAVIRLLTVATDAGGFARLAELTLFSRTVDRLLFNEPLLEWLLETRLGACFEARLDTLLGVWWRSTRFGVLRRLGAATGAFLCARSLTQ